MTPKDHEKMLTALGMEIVETQGIVAGLIAVALFSDHISDPQREEVRKRLLGWAMETMSRLDLAEKITTFGASEN